MRLAIVGLGLLGTSVGLGLKAVAPEVYIMGHDPDGALARRAKTLGAIDASHWNLVSACEEADLILLDLPLQEMEKTLTALRDEIKEGVVIVDTVPVKRSVLDLAERLMAEKASFIGGHIVCPRSWRQAEPSAELLKGATFYLVASKSTAPEALDLASNLAMALGAEPRYIDAAEHDGLAAATTQLPMLNALALMETVAAERGREDRAHSMGKELAAVASLLSEAPLPSVKALLVNADNLLFWLDAYLNEVTALRCLISEQNGKVLSERLHAGSEMCKQWLSGHGSGRGATGEERSHWRQMFLGGWGRTRK